MSEQTTSQSPKIELSQLKEDKVETLPTKLRIKKKILIDIEDVNLIERIKWATTNTTYYVRIFNRDITYYFLNS